jgi:hypothetical protein
MKVTKGWNNFFSQFMVCITPAIKHINGRDGACSAQSGRGKQRPYIMGCDV